MKLIARRVCLGDLLGPLRNLGCCDACRRQFMSTREMVTITPNLHRLCDKCAKEKQT